MLLSARPYLGGDYTCVAENEAGSAKATTILTVFEPTDDRQMAHNLTVKTVHVGGNITFSCVMSSNPPAQIRWLKDEKDIYSALPQDRFTISPDGSTLTLLHVNMEDQGEFKCIATNIPGSWNYRYTLEVTSSPGILRHSSTGSRVDVNEGSELRLQCLAVANPEPVYQWLKDDTPLTIRVLNLGEEPTETSNLRSNTTAVSGRFSIHDNGRLLIIRNIQANEFGQYTDEAVPSTVIYSQGAPNFGDGKDHESPVFERGKPHSLWCNVTGNPEPVIRWEYDLPVTGPGDRNIQDRLKGRQLYLPSVDHGVITRYACVAKNRAGEIRKVFDPTLVCKYLSVLTTFVAA
ncbi:hypothetical protein AHF37_09234 [Paragonimus kellicotti]|nr:hypothetical protein AHF37_09234 [Paragonimus kellicotti]